MVSPLSEQTAQTNRDMVERKIAAGYDLYGLGPPTTNGKRISLNVELISFMKGQEFP